MTDNNNDDNDPLAKHLAPDGAAVLVGILHKGPTDDDWHLYLNRGRGLSRHETES